MKTDFINGKEYPLAFVKFYNTLINKGKAKKCYQFKFDGRRITVNYGDEIEHFICHFCEYNSPETLYCELLDYNLIKRM